MRGTTHAVLTILAKDLRLRIRDRSAFVVGILAPLVLATILSQVVGDFGTGGEFSATFAVVDEDEGDIGSALAEQINDSSTGLEAIAGLSQAEARNQLDSGELDAVIVIPEGYAASLQPGVAGGPAELTVLGNADTEVSTVIAQGVAESIASQSEAVRLSVTAALTAPSGETDRTDEADEDPSASIDELVAEAQAQPSPIGLEQATAAERELDSTTYLMAGLGALFLFFLAQYGVIGLLEERQSGTMARLLAAPIPALAIPVAKALTSFVMGLAGMATLAGVSTLAFGADWGAPLAVVVLVVAMVLVAVSVVGLVCAFAKTPDQASNVQSAIAVLLGLFGGSFFPLARGEGLLSKVSLATPHYWFLRGLAEGKGGFAAALPSVGVLLLIAVVVGGAAVLLLRRGVWR